MKVNKKTIVAGIVICAASSTANASTSHQHIEQISLNDIIIEGTTYKSFNKPSEKERLLERKIDVAMPGGVDKKRHARPHGIGDILNWWKSLFAVSKDNSLS